MAQRFDTGLAKSQRALIRDAIVTRLAPLKKTSNPQLYLQAIATLPRPIRGASDPQLEALLTDGLLTSAPAVAVALGRCKFDGGGSDALEVDGELDVYIYVASQHDRGVTEGRLYGDAIATAANTADPGIFTMLEHVRERLIGQGLGIDTVGELRPVEEDEVTTAGNITVWEQHYTATVHVVVNPQRDIVQLLTSVENKVDSDGTLNTAASPLVKADTNIPAPIP